MTYFINQIFDLNNFIFLLNVLVGIRLTSIKSRILIDINDLNNLKVYNFHNNLPLNIQLCSTSS